MRTIVAIVVGYLAWTAIWLGGNSLLFADLADSVESGERVEDAARLGPVLALSLVCSLVAGYAAGRLAPATRAVLATGVLLLATGIAVQASAWELMPTWYHLAFLALLLPIVLLGGRLAPHRYGVAHQPPPD